MRLSLSVVLFAALAPVAQAQPPRYVDLVNQGGDSVVSLQVAPHAAAAFDEVVLDGPLRGGGDSQTIAVAREGCRYDLRFGYADGRTLRYEDVDLCRYGKVSVRPLPRAAREREFVVVWAAPAGDQAASSLDRAEASR